MKRRPPARPRHREFERIFSIYKLDLLRLDGNDLHRMAIALNHSLYQRYP